MEQLKKLKLLIQFDGHEYLGWQVQKDSTSTVQGKINSVLSKIYKIPIKTVGSGRTDAGVHSLGHHVVYKAPFEIPYPAIIKGLNAQLPKNIRVLEVTQVEEGFRPTNDATSKTYHYLFTNLEIPSPFQEKYITNIFYKLDFDLMRRACELFIGKYDFNRFQCKGSEPISTTREIYSLELKFKEVDMHGIIPSHYYFEITGNGFLKQMVRLIVSAIWDVGRGRLSLSDIEDALSNPSGGHICSVAPPYGLYKMKVEYSQNFDNL